MLTEFHHRDTETQLENFKLCLCVSVVICIALLAATAAQGATPPRVFLVEARGLSETRQKILSGDKTLDAPLRKLEEDARKALGAGPFSVTSKTVAPPSGDKHDYMSQAPYFWPDPKQPNGLPYIRRDGERNPEINGITDHREMDRMVEAVGALALAYYLKGDEAYAAKAAQLLRAWFIEPATRMNPHLEYAQFIPGVNTGRGIGLIETRGLTRVVDAVGLLEGSKAWTKQDQRGVEDWYEKFLRWMLESRNGRDEAKAVNNHGTFYDVQVASFALFLNKRELAKRIVEEARGKRVAAQIEPDGKQPLELARTRAWGYSVGNLDGLLTLAELGERVGVDLWHYQTHDGRGLRRALEYLYPFALGDAKWPHQQLGEWPPEMLYPLMRRAATRYTDAPFAALMRRIPAVEPSSRELLLSKSQGFDVAAFDRARVLKAARLYLSEQPLTVTASRSPRSAGGPHDFFSEGDYWWPDSQNPSGPYVQRDGMTNPDNFVGHRRALMRLSVQVAALAAAWKLTKDERYARHAALHLRAWFIDPATQMSPHLEYAQAIQGRTKGRGIGIIDTIHLVEVARAVEVLEGSRALTPAEVAGVKKWFADYLQWMTTSKNGIEEREAKNNHGTCWVMQVAAFAHLTGNRELLDYCRARFREVLVPNQLAADGSFPQELRRTKPYGYSLFNLEALATICRILSTERDDLWKFELPDGRGMKKAMEYMAPFIRDKKAWPLAPDVMYDAEWPMRQSSLLFAGLALGRPDYMEIWKRLPADSTVEEVVRNFFIRQPVLWMK
jgi:hypothetical protein